MDLDRIGPSRRDACSTRSTGRQTWRDLLFVHWEVPVELLRSLVPPPLSIDVFQGRAYVGLVPFTMHDVRFGPLPVDDFLETNLRTYVHAEGVPGVWFFSFDAQSRMAVWGARAFYRLPYRVRVHHRAWPLRNARLGRLETNIPLAAGIRVGDPIDLVLASIDGVAVETFARERL